MRGPEASDSAWPAIGAMAGWAAASCAGWGITGLALARALRRSNVVDTMWGLGPCLIAAVDAAAAGRHGTGDRRRRGLLLGCAGAWGLRLSWHVGRRSAGRGEDPRYADLLARGRGSPLARSATLVFAPQAAALFVVSLPIQFGMAEDGPVGPLGWLGAITWLTGFGFEAIGDEQLRRFKADPANRGKIAGTGLWRYTRHPNYFGDAVAWAGIFLITAERWPGPLTIISPALMTYMLVRGTGKRLLERSMAGRPGYAEYMRDTSGFFPLPPGLRGRLAGRAGGPPT